ncbi:MAG TPA: guanylate kinase [Deltaproteobacteria bacterium]|nr:guanylate kinase [Deltaproteobacteria bacterium]
MKQGLFIVVSAPSGAGKTSICQKMLEVCPKIKFSVSHTSRKPRPKEINGRDYHFISREVFKKDIKEGYFVEWVENYGELYGTSYKEMENNIKRGKDLLLDVEPRGAKKIKRKLKGGVFVFVLPPSYKELERRLRKRGHESGAAIKTRLAQAQCELKEISWYDYVIFNKDLGKAVEQLRSIYIAEKCRRRFLNEEINNFMKNQLSKDGGY